jgi:hypothetical protein
MDTQDSDSIFIGYNESLQIYVRVMLYPQASLTLWSFKGKNSESKVILDNIDGYSITDTWEGNKQSTILTKRSVDTEDFGEYTLIVRNDVGYFTRIYHVEAARELFHFLILKINCTEQIVKVINQLN